MNNFHFAKIIVTMWPSLYRETILSKVTNYIDIFRINLSYTNDDLKRKYIETINKIDSSKWIMIDIKWPEVRTQNTKNINLTWVDEIFIKYSQLKNDENHTIFIDYENIAWLTKWKNICIDWNRIILKIKEKLDDWIMCQVVTGWEIFPNSSVTFENYIPKISFITEKDKNDILWAIRNQISMISFWCIKNHKDIITARDFLNQNWWENIKVISKIETKESIEDIDEIIKISDWIIISREKLWFNIPLEDIPLTQLKIIKLCNSYWKPVILGNQVLETMRNETEPSKAELDEIVLNIINWVDGFMLATETAVWNHPVESILTLHNAICKNQEKIIESFRNQEKTPQESDLQDTLIYNAYNMAQNNWVKAILCPTESWYTPAKLASLKTQVPIIAFTKNDYVFKYMNLLRAVKWYKISTTLDYNLIKRVWKEMIRMMFKWDISLDDKIIILNINSNIAQNIPNMINWIEIYKFKEL